MTDVTDETNETDNTNQPEFKNIRNYLEGGWDNREVSIGILATAIEKEGIYTWDRFGRFGKASENEKERIFDLLAYIYKYENDYSEPPCEHDEHPLDVYNPDDPFSFFGWPEDDIPDFENIAKGHVKTARSRPETPQARAGNTKKQNTYLLIIAALCNNQDIVLGKKGNAAKIKRFIELLGLNLNEETIRTVLKAAKEAVEQEE